MGFLESEFKELSEHYDELARQHGYSPNATQQSSVETQEKRLNVLLNLSGNLKNKKILDFGCGTGHLLHILRKNGFKGEYVGYDISSELLNIARQHYPEARFELKNILNDPIDESFDYIFISGVFNNDIGCNQLFMKKILTKLFKQTKESMVFNALSCYVDYKNQGLYYFDPSWVFEFCKTHLTTHVSLNHAYEIKPGVIPFEFSIRLDKTAFHPVALHD